MSRINTNVSSLIAQNTLQRSNAELQTALNRLSTGLRINAGKDDPAGLIASENLRRDITGLEKAVVNTERANQLIATADSALGQVSSLLNDIRGLVTEAANAGALSAEQIAANQLQVDSSLEAIDRIARVTTFQGRRVLDGSLGFLTGGTVSNFDNLSDLQIQSANLGTSGSISVEIAISTAATKGSISTSLGTGGAGSTASTSVDLSALDDGVASTTGTINLATQIGGSSTGQISVTATTKGTASDSVAVRIVDDATIANNAAEVSYNGTNQITIRTNGTAVTTSTIVNAFSSISEFTAAEVAAGTVDSDVDVTTTPVALGTTANGRNAAGSFTITTDSNLDDYNTYTVEIVDDTNLAADVVTASLDTTNKKILFAVDANSTNLTVAKFRDAINLDSTLGALFTVTGETGAALDAVAGGVNSTQTQIGTAALTGGADPTSAGLAGDVVFELSGTDGAQVFQFDSGTGGDAIVSAVNLVSDATGVSAGFSGGTLTFTSTAFGKAAFAGVDVISDAGTFEANFTGNILRATGGDAAATVNGVQANSAGNDISINTATLDLQASLVAGLTATINFDITGGGALFQLGPDVVSNQQARLGIDSVTTANLGGVNGKLYEIASGEAKSLANKPTDAAKVVDEVITKISELRGRLGAFQRTTLESNLVSLNDTLANLSEAESSIRDADFAAESARLTRAQILVQSGTSVLTIANQNPQNVLALLR